MKNIINLPDSYAATYVPHPQVQEFFNLLEPNPPAWLSEYINTPEMLHQQHISTTCGTIYSDLFESDFFYSNLDHSVGVALIVWHFTHDKKQTLAGLFHDIATPAFKHCVDFMNGDYMTQESTEELTTQIIENSPEITTLLERDKIKISEVDNYHLYPIADNDTPKLSADRLEYFLAHGLFTYRTINFDQAKMFYQDIEVEKDRQGVLELGFKTKKIAQDFIRNVCILSTIFHENRTRFSLQFLADILKKLNTTGYIGKTDLYKLKESEIVDIIKHSKYANAFNKWRNAKSVKVSGTQPENTYYIHHPAKVRYVDPLCQGTRMSESCQLAKQMINKNLSYDMSKYVYLDNVLI